MKRKRPENPALYKRVLFTVEPDLLRQIDDRADSLLMSRSAYLCQIARKDISEGGDLAVKADPLPTQYPPHLDEFGVAAETPKPPPKPKKGKRPPEEGENPGASRKAV